MPIDLPANREIDVVFATSLAAALQGRLSDPAVVITPDPNNWNDYGRRLYANMYVHRSGQPSANEPIRFMFADRDDTDIEIRRLIQTYGDVVPIERSEQLHCALLPNPEAYQSFVERLGFDEAVSALRKMGDAVIVRVEGTDQDRLRLIDTEAFYVSVLRSDSAYAALRRGSRYLQRVPPAPVDDAASTFVLVAQLPNVRNRYSLTFNFSGDPFGRDRVAVLIGRNGVGKTQLLRHLILNLAGDYEQGEGFAGDVRVYPRPKARRVLMFSSVASDPYPETIPPWCGVDYEYFSMTAPRERGADALLQALVACRREFAPLVVRGQAYSRQELLEKILRPMGLWRRLHLPLRQPRGDDDPFRMVLRWGDRRYFPISTNLNELLSLKLVREIDWSDSPVIFGDDGAPRHLSSGELAMFRFAAQAVSAIEPGSLLLFDEPETHLHPNFVSDFMEILQDLLQATASAAIIATHSAYVVREVPRERVSVITVTDHEVEVDAPRMQTFGASIDTISQFVFSDTSVSHRYQTVLEHWLNGQGRDLTIEQIVEQFGKELNPESLSYLAELKRRQAAGSAG